MAGLQTLLKRLRAFARWPWGDQCRERKDWDRWDLALRALHRKVLVPGGINGALAVVRQTEDLLCCQLLA
eukprot:11194755-Lingulodinium_polyedra.AAC.1